MLWRDTIQYYQGYLVRWGIPSVGDTIRKLRVFSTEGDTISAVEDVKYCRKLLFSTVKDV